MRETDAARDRVDEISGVRPLMVNIENHHSYHCHRVLD